MTDLDTLIGLVGDTPVSEQICIAINQHIQESKALVKEVEDLKRKIEMLMNLVGDTPVSEQINVAINNK